MVCSFKNRYVILLLLWVKLWMRKAVLFSLVWRVLSDWDWNSDSVVLLKLNSWLMVFKETPSWRWMELWIESSVLLCPQSATWFLWLVATPLPFAGVFNVFGARLTFVSTQQNSLINVDEVRWDLETCSRRNNPLSLKHTSSQFSKTPQELCCLAWNSHRVFSQQTSPIWAEEPV